MRSSFLLFSQKVSSSPFFVQFQTANQQQFSNPPSLVAFGDLHRIKHWRKHGGAPPEGVGQAVGQAAAIIRKATERRQGGFAGRGNFGGGGGGPPPPGGGGGGFQRGGGGGPGFGRGRGFDGARGGGFVGGRGPPPPGRGFPPPGYGHPGQFGPR